jgi:FixJ family two-component response regulator
MPPRDVICEGSDMNFKYTSSGQRLYQAPAAPVVFVVDGDEETRNELQALIRSTGWEARTAASAEEFLTQERATTPSCLLVELELPGSSGLDLQRLVADRTDLPVIFMARRADVHATVRAMKGGAFEFLTKPVVPEVLLDSIRAALERSETARRHLQQIQALQERYESLSRREREVMSLLVRGRLNKQVGGELGISEITVKAHRGRMMRKMRAASFAELVTMAASLRGDLRASIGDFAMTIPS